MADPTDPGEDAADLTAPTYSALEALDEVCTQAFIVAHLLLQRSHSHLDEITAKALIRFILEDAKPLLMELGDDCLLPNICPECFTNLDEITTAATSEAHREHVTDEEIERLNEALYRSSVTPPVGRDAELGS